MTGQLLAYSTQQKFELKKEILAVVVNTELKEVYLIEWFKYHKAHYICETHRATTEENAIMIGIELSEKYGVKLEIE